MGTVKLTRREIDASRAQARRTGVAVVLWDEDLKGFGCRVAPSGKASWLVKKLLGTGGRGSKAVKHVFGDYAETNPDKARDQAIALIGDIRKGVDLTDRKRQDRKAQREVFKSGKLQDVADTYIKRRTEPGRFWSELEGRFKREIIPTLGKNTLVAKITKADIRHLIESKEEKYPVAARTMFEALRPFFKWCVERDLITVSPLANLQPPAIAEARDRLLNDDEIKAFWKATDALGWPFGPFYRLLLLTGQRREEVGGMSRDEIAEATWTIPRERTKNNKVHVVHLSDQSIAVLGTIDPIEGCPFVFTTTGESTISGYSKAKARLDTVMQRELGKKNLQPWRVHDLRRTAASGMAKLGFAPHIVERVLNHTSGAQGGLVAVYQRYEYLEERKRAIEAWGNYVEALIVDRPMADNVRSLRA